MAVVLVGGLLLAETGREIAVFLSWSRFYEKAYWTIDARIHNDTLTKSELIEIAGPPTDKKTVGVPESWDWETAKHRGPILRIVPLPLTRNPYHLTVEFNADGFVSDVFSTTQ